MDPPTTVPTNTPAALEALSAVEVAATASAIASETSPSAIQGPWLRSVGVLRLGGVGEVICQGCLDKARLSSVP